MSWSQVVVGAQVWLLGCGAYVTGRLCQHLRRRLRRSRRTVTMRLVMSLNAAAALRRVAAEQEVSTLAVISHGLSVYMALRRHVDEAGAEVHVRLPNGDCGVVDFGGMREYEPSPELAR